MHSNLTTESQESSRDHQRVRPGMSRDRTSSIHGGAPMTAPPSVSPEPAYIAASAASQIVTTDHQTQTENWFEDRPEKADADTAIVSPASLTLINAFLDQLLYSFLSSARSTSIAALRPAVSEVLKPRLARDAINGADQELAEFLGGGDAEELSAFHNGLVPRGPWDLQLVWRRTRLRCMVYTRLGDMEEEDEEAFVKMERAQDEDEGLRRLSRDLGIVSPAAAIFLTSILEFIGEQVLIVAGEAAYARIQLRRMKESAEDESSFPETLRVVVEDSDMEKLAFSTTFGRLWRSWKKRVRTPSMLSARTMSRDFSRGKGSLSPNSKQASRKASIGEADEPGQVSENSARPSVAAMLEEPLNADNSTSVSTADRTGDYREQLGAQPLNPGLASRHIGNRPHSIVLYPQSKFEASVQNGSRPVAPFSVMQRSRSSSLPALQPAPYASPLNETFFTPSSPLNQSRSFQGEEELLSAHVPLCAPKGHATNTIGDDSKLRLTSQRKQQSGGISKEEFDRQMLEMVQDSDSHSPDTAASVTSDRDSYPQALTSEHSNAAADEQTSGGTQSVQPEGYSRPQPSKNRGLHEDVLKYWRGGESLDQESAPVASHQTDLEGSRSSKDGLMQGERPQMASADHDYGRIWEHQAPYFYQGPTASNSNQSTKALISQSKDWQNSIPEASGDENCPPPLTPLRELMEAAHDTSDEASSLALSHETSKPECISPERSQTVDFARAEAYSPRVVSQAKHTSKCSDLRSKLPAVNTGTERAAVQRVLPSPVSAREPLTPVPRTSSSSNRELRQVQTSSSSTSQVSQKLKGLVARDSSDGRRPTTSRRSSEGSSSMISDKRSLRTPKADEAQRNFDQLIKSDETIQYTLTPQNMREMEAPDSPRWNPHRRTNTAEMAEFFRNTGPEEPLRPWTSHSKVSLKGLNGLAANPINIVKPTEPTRPALEAKATPAKTTSRPSTSHSHSGVARQARANSESTRDFADFLRSTGPSQAGLAEAQVSQQQTGPPVAAPRPINALPAASRPLSGHGPKKITKQNPSSVSQHTEPPPSTGPVMLGEAAGPIPIKKRLPKLQARDATVSTETSSDLIEFIRQGPSDRSEGRLRLPRTGDPARLSADTNGITRGINSRPSEGNDPRLSVASTQLSSVPSKSARSVNSRTGLLETGSPTRDARHKISESLETRQGPHDETPQLIRKRHRNKDPYAIDTDSEGEGDPRVPPHKVEESLIDFLNSVAPPSSQASTSNALAHGTMPSKNPAPLKNQYPNMRDRLTRNGVSGAKSKAVPKEVPMGIPSITRNKNEARQTATTNTPSRIHGSQTTSTSTPNNRGRPEATHASPGNVIRSQAPQLPPLNPRETSPHLISQVGRKVDSYKITHPTYAAHVDRERNGAAHRSPVQHYQARGNREPDHALSDLADFLKNSEPPTTPAKVESPPAKEKEKETGFGRMFSRRKKGSQT